MAPPTASLVYETADNKVDTTVLNAKGYIDLAFSAASGLSINADSIIDSASEIVISGSAVAEAIVGSVTALGNDVYRFRFTDSNLLNNVGLFQEGTLTISLVAGTFEDSAGNQNALDTIALQLVSGKAAGTSSVNIGPLAIIAPTIGISGFQFKAFNAAGDLAPTLIMTVSIGAAVASLNFSGGSTEPSNAGPTVSLGGLVGSFDLAIELDVTDLFGIPEVGATGAFRIEIATLLVSIPDLLTITGTGIVFGYDPAGADDQELFRVDSL